MSILKADHITRYFHDPVTFKVLDDVSFSIDKGEFISVTGKSGSGKSTMLYVLSTMDTGYEGNLWIDDECMNGKSESYLAAVRNQKIGFVFQFHYLLNEFTVLENVMLPALKLKRLSRQQVKEKALEKLAMLDIQKLAHKKANQISGGEKQRVAIARALINDPQIIMGDEPTGNLDKRNSDLVFDIFRQLNDSMQQTLLIVTHDQQFAKRTQRVINMEDGRVVR